MDRIPPVKSVMTPFPHSIGIDSSLEEARRVMDAHDIRHLPVVDEQRLVSVVSRRELDLARATGADGHGLRQACTAEAYVVELGDPLDRVLGEMAERHVDCALVVKGGKLAGIFTLTDVCRSYRRLLRTLFPAGGDDRVA